MAVHIMYAGAYVRVMGRGRGICCRAGDFGRAIERVPSTALSERLDDASSAVSAFDFRLACCRPIAHAPSAASRIDIAPARLSGIQHEIML